MVLPTIISRIFDPFILLTITFVLAAYRTGLAGSALISYGAVILGIMIFPSVGLLLWAIRTKRVKNWDLSDRRERVKGFLVFFLFLGIDTVVEQIIGTSGTHQFFWFFLLFIVGFFGITLRYKISGHMATLLFWIGCIIWWYGWSWWPLLFIIFPVAWARLVLKRHTWGEVVGGTLYSMVFLFISLFLGIV